MKYFKRLLLLIAVVALVGLIRGSAHAVAQSSDTITISMTPISDYGITVAGNVNFGSVELNTVYLSTGIVVSTVTNSGTVVSDWKIGGTNAANWSLAGFTSTDTAMGEDTIGLWAVLSDTNTVESTVEAHEWAYEDSIVHSESHNMFNDIATDHGRYYLNAEGDNVPAGAQRRIWFRLRTPNGTTATVQQDFSVTIEAWVSDTF